MLAFYVIAIVVAKCSTIITNPKCGERTPNECYKKHISVLGEVIREGKKKKNRKKRKKEGNYIIINGVQK